MYLRRQTCICLILPRHRLYWRPNVLNRNRATIIEHPINYHASRCLRFIMAGLREWNQPIVCAALAGRSGRELIMHQQCHHRIVHRDLETSNGEGAFVVVEPSKFKTVSEKTTLRQDLSNALQIRVFQRVTRLSRCEVDLLKKEMSENDVPISYSGGGGPQKSIRKTNLEEILRRLLNFLEPETFQGAVKAINEKNPFCLG
ncbi:hypothetical protein SLEP1_g4096 [Rubroshorea leprosula]|uniref:Uncharacterized protein n=1 Tax=Rubroshorea leprosula TaxID=152421 RepID=A0AAV5HVS1_9ROSI|nr:hypothetical protein SLEP1_g4096 [Rubroshorea leprosula]